MKPLVSVIVPTKDSAAYLPRCLDSIVSQTYVNLEIIVVDNYSNDETVEIARRFKSKIILIPDSERSEQVNYGVMIARGKYVYRVDSDFVLSAEVIEQAVAKAETGYPAVVVNNFSDSTVSFWARVRLLEKELVTGDWAHTAPTFFSKELFTEVGGYNERLVAGEDYDIRNRIATKHNVAEINARITHLGEPKTLGQIVRKFVYYGSVIDLFFEENPGKGAWQIAPIRLIYWRKRRLFAQFGPKVFLGFIVYQYTRYMAALFGYMTVKMS